MKEKKMIAGIIGCGNISDIYLKNLTSIFSNVDLKGCYDINPEAARKKAEEYGIKAYGPEILEDEDIDIIINLTNPAAHAEIDLKVLEAGKHVYSEKPLAINFEDGKEILELAEDRGLMVGCAPDTFMGGGLQTCRKLLDDGWIGIPVGGNAFMGYSGPESWHPDPAFLYHKGAGPLFDMGPYYLTALVSMLGTVESVTATARITFAERMITSEPKYGEMIQVEEPTHVTAILNFESGVSITLTISFDVYDTRIPNLELYGNKGSMVMPDPNTYGGPVLLSRESRGNWSEMPLSHGYTENSRGLAVSDMATARQDNRPYRASGKLALHILEVMHGIKTASETKTLYTVTTRCDQPDPMGLK